MRPLHRRIDGGLSSSPLVPMTPGGAEHEKTQSVGLVIDTVVCLALAKWETVSGRFGGYLTGRQRALAQAPARSAT
jgi:hypothetical protein